MSGGHFDIQQEVEINNDNLTVEVIDQIASRFGVSVSVVKEIMSDMNSDGVIFCE
jgi:ribosomal protein S25